MGMQGKDLPICIFIFLKCSFILVPGITWLGWGSCNSKLRSFRGTYQLASYIEWQVWKLFFQLVCAIIFPKKLLFPVGMCHRYYLFSCTGCEKTYCICFPFLWGLYNFGRLWACPFIWYVIGIYYASNSEHSFTQLVWLEEVCSCYLPNVCGGVPMICWPIFAE
jgi:hypothetical protein